MISGRYHRDSRDILIFHFRVGNQSPALESNFMHSRAHMILQCIVATWIQQKTQTNSSTNSTRNSWNHLLCRIYYISTIYPLYIHYISICFTALRSNPTEVGAAIIVPLGIHTKQTWQVEQAMTPLQAHSMYSSRGFFHSPLLPRGWISWLQAAPSSTSTIVWWKETTGDMIKNYYELLWTIGVSSYRNRMAVFPMVWRV